MSSMISLPELLIFGVLCLIFLPSILISWMLSTAVARVPAGLRRISPPAVWLLVVPFFNLAWNFVVFRQVPRSLRDYFTERGGEGPGDCGEGLGLAYSILSCFILVPKIGPVAWVAAFVLVVLFIIKVHRLSREVQNDRSFNPQESPS